MGHLSLECPAAQMPEVLERLRAARVPFRKNVRWEKKKKKKGRRKKKVCIEVEGLPSTTDPACLAAPAAPPRPAACLRRTKPA